MQLNNLFKSFKIPLLILVTIVLSVLLNTLHFYSYSNTLAILATILGSYRLFKESLNSILKHRFALDYIAMLAIIVSITTGEYLVASIIALMISSGRTLEDYGVAQAKTSLTKLIDRIPNDVIVVKNYIQTKVKIAKVKKGQQILIRKGEVIGLDGILISDSGLTDESSLTGEPYPVEKIKSDQIRSGTVNIGESIIVEVTKEEANSTYRKIIDMVKKAQNEKAPLIRLADKYSVIFTLTTLLIAGFAYFYSRSAINVLAVLVIATPCPLILATPIALLGGVSASAKKRIIVKKLASLEALSRINTIIFDKTGTITIGKPKITEFKNLSKEYKDNDVLAIAEALERNSLHPLAKALVNFAKEKNATIIHAKDVKEKIGEGVTGIIDNKKYTLSKMKNEAGTTIELKQNSHQIAIFTFEDEIKSEVKEIVDNLKKMGLSLFIFTGDKKEAAEKVVKELGGNVTIQAECTPEDKRKGIEAMSKNGRKVAMVGDGINDAPALALADVGMVFSNEEQTAASQASDIVFLGGDFSLVLDSLNIARKTIKIAMQSIVWGIGISIFGMVFASFGLIPPITGAFLQELIDVAVIINALRASR